MTGRAAFRWLALVAGAVLLLVWWIRADTPLPEKVDPYSRASFDRWLREDPGHARQFEEFQRFLVANRVENAVPNWQLLRTDRTPIVGCKRPAFLLPPRAKWPNIVGGLRLVGTKIVPRIGRVEAVSTYRTTDFNDCVGGASRSQHLDFAGVDLIALEQRDKRAMFRQLCALHRELGSISNFGLGAYFDPDSLVAPNSGRFHVDVAGYRSWGYSKHAASSGCRLLAS